MKEKRTNIYLNIAYFHIIDKYFLGFSLRHPTYSTFESLGVVVVFAEEIMRKKRVDFYCGFYFKRGIISIQYMCDLERVFIYRKDRLNSL